MRFSVFNIYVRVESGVIIKNMYTGAVICTPDRLFDLCKENESDLRSAFTSYGADIDSYKENGLIVENETDEFIEWKNELLILRNDRAHRFTLHFLPTIQCQFRCHYCFENGADRGVAMQNQVLVQTVTWLSEYLTKNPEVDQFRMVLFGGEPLLRSDICITALHQIHSLCMTRGIEFWSELVTNGELLSNSISQEFARFNWKRVQITLDGPENVHNVRRPGVNSRKTFRNIVRNIQSLLQGDAIQAVDIRLSFDLSNCDAVIAFLDEIQNFGEKSKINLSLGFITDTFVFEEGDKDDPAITLKALEFWRKAHLLGFQIPESQIAGPLCVAVAKHSAVVLPDGSLQKCFATAGRPEYNFSTVQILPKGYTQDKRFEAWKRTDDCIKESCQYLPVCGGGCPNDAMINAGGPEGGENRYCQKQFLSDMNEGLVKINFG